MFTSTTTTTITLEEITQHTNFNTCSIMWTGCERSSSRAIETTINGNGNGHGGGSSINVAAGPGSSQQETLADIEHISTIAGSLVSIGSISHTQPRYGTNDAGYDTEHTSLNSDFDEAELRRELLRDKWKILFDMFDPEGFGEITVDEFIIALKSPEFISQVPLNKRELLLERAKKAKLPIGPGYITFQDFVNVLHSLNQFATMESRLRLEPAITTFDKETRIWRGKQVKPTFGENDSIGTAVLETLLKSPEHINQICYPSGKEYTNKEIATLSVRVAINLQKLHLQQCDVIGLCASNSDFVAPLTFGALLCGLCISTLDPSFDKEGIRHAFSITRPKVMFCDGNIYDKVKMALKECGLLNTPIYTISNHIEGASNLMELMVPSDKERAFNAPTLEKGWNQVAMILCSSGTTGLPKAVTMSHACILNAVKFEMCSTDRFLCFSTLYWLTGLATLIHGTISGVTRVISNRPYTAHDFLDIVERFKVTIVLSPPSQIAMTLAEDRINESDLSSIELYMSGGSPVPYLLVEKFKRFVPNAIFVVGYSMSEVCAWVAHQEIDSANSVGQLGPNIEIKIIDDKGNNLEEHQVGEICIRTPYPWAGYYNDPEATAKMYDKDGWIHSGDVGYFDIKGRLYIVDRIKDILKYNNFHFYPTQIEKVIIELPDIIDVCVVGIPDITYTHLPAAAVVVRPNSNLTEQYILDYVASKLQHFEHLHGGVYFVQSLPRTVSGKTVRRKVVELCENLYKQRNIQKYKINSIFCFNISFITTQIVFENIGAIS